MADSDSDVDDVLSNLLSNEEDPPAPGGPGEPPKVLKKPDHNSLNNLTESPSETPPEKSSKSPKNPLKPQNSQKKKTPHPLPPKAPKSVTSGSKSDSSSDVDDILNNLLSNEEDPPAPGGPPKVLKELDYNFLDKLNESPTKTPEEKSRSLIHNDSDSSDDEDKKYFEAQKYSDSGRSIRDLLKHQSAPKKETSALFPRRTGAAPKASTPKTDEPRKKAETALTTWLSKPPDVYSDPVFGLRIVKPLISSAELKERMQDRRPITVSKIKSFVATQDQSQDWVIAGVLIHRSATKKSLNGNQYCIWQISDLSEKIPSVSLFLFSGAYKLFWKTSEGTIVGVLNPNVLESRSDKAEATLSVDNAQKIMILGNSRDLGRCKSVKKSGDPCTNIVNKSRCEYCVYHVKQEYSKASRRTDLQTDSNNRRFGSLGKQSQSQKFGGMSSQGNGLNHLNMLAIPAKRNHKMEQRDSERLALLTQGSTGVSKGQTSGDNLLDLERIGVSTGWSNRSALCLSSISNLSKGSPKSSPSSTGGQSGSSKPSVASPRATVPRLGCGVVGDTIDFSQPIPKKGISSAKMSAIKWAKEKGGIKSGNANKIRESREKMEASAKRKREEADRAEESEKDAKKVCSTSDKFRELMELTSAHEDLIEKSDENEKEKYFNKLEARERMEEKMMTTFKVDCKAVRCLVCKYTSFSASDICKEKRHPLRVIDAVKSFFKCADCGNRTVSLDKLPSYSCQKCSGSRWLRAAMMDERKTNISDCVLSIRGGEEKFVGSEVKNSSINLLVPSDDA
ncbi:protein MCM10 homolog [Diachasma alloeum]|uniref:protein MCM10 homolog n=1 Tax=Diachasma alloeum TaxID=454923 RepID=UPI000738219B|nr:protein MCM10 homolog [Diachasma alloeum]